VSPTTTVRPTPTTNFHRPCRARAARKALTLRIYGTAE
jgi:hypothetical protein